MRHHFLDIINNGKLSDVEYVLYNMEGYSIRHGAGRTGVPTPLLMNVVNFIADFKFVSASDEGTVHYSVTHHPHNYYYTVKLSCHMSLSLILQ